MVPKFPCHCRRLHELMQQDKCDALRLYSTSLSIMKYWSVSLLCILSFHSSLCALVKFLFRQIFAVGWITPPIGEVNEEVGQSGIRQSVNDQIGDIVGEHEKEDDDPVAEVDSAHSVSFWLPLASVGFGNKFATKQRNIWPMFTWVRLQIYSFKYTNCIRGGSAVAWD